MVDKIREEIQNVDFFIEKSPRTGEYTLALSKYEKKQYVLSKYRPHEDALRMLGEEWNNKSTIWIIFGLGFGYMLEEIISRVGEMTKVLIIEPNQELLDAQTNIGVVKRLLELKNVVVLSGIQIQDIKKRLKQFIPATEFNNICIRYIEGYLEYYSEYYKVILSFISDIKNRMEIDFYSTLRNEDYCNFNTIQNINDIASTYDMSYHKNRYKHIPALIVGAGPSLENNIEEIKTFNGIVFVIGRTMTPIIDLDIRPDFVVSLDPFDVIYETFDKYKVHDIPLITLTSSNSKVVKGSKGPKYFLHNTTMTSQLFSMKVNPCLDLYGSVSTLAVSSAKYMGCSPIIFVGQDLAYTGNKTHSDLAFKSSKNRENNILNTVKQLPKVRGYYGNEVSTNYVWSSIIGWLEDFIYKTKDDTIYVNATEGGAYIEGAEHISLKECIAKYDVTEKTIITHMPIKQNETIDIDQRLRLLKKDLKNIYRALQFGKVYYSQLVSQYTINNEGNNELEINKVVEKIKRLDSIIMNIDESKPIIKIVMKKIKMVLSTSNNNKEPISETAEQRRIRFLRLNYETYEQLIKETKKLIQFIEGEMEI